MDKKEESKRKKAMWSCWASEEKNGREESCPKQRRRRRCWGFLRGKTKRNRVTAEKKEEEVPTGTQEENKKY